MNRTIVFILILFLPVGLTGQLNYVSDLNNLEKIIINPAFAGSRDALSVTALYRNHWTGFENGPKNYSVSMHAPLYHRRMGLGLFVENSSVGIFRKTNIMADYAYNIELSKGKLAFGLGFGATIYNIAWNDLVASQGGDILLMNAPVTAAIPNVSLGTYYYSRNYFIGFSVPFIFGRAMNDIPGESHMTFDLNQNIFHLNGGYSFRMHPHFSLKPSILLKYQPAGTAQVDCILEASLREKISLGVGYRNQNTMIAMLDVRLNPQFTMAYAYDFDLSPLGKYKGGTHEVGINYLFSFERNVAGPRQF